MLITHYSKSLSLSPSLSLSLSLSTNVFLYQKKLNGFSFLLQKKVILEVKPMLEESITELYCTTFPECLKIADLGCSSGPNTLLPLWEIVECIGRSCVRLSRKPPMFQVFLNDLPHNDFNSIFRSLGSFYEKLEKEKEKEGGKFGECLSAGMPGSFHKRLFPDHSIHFVHSSYGLHWLSQVSGIIWSPISYYIFFLSIFRVFLFRFISIVFFIKFFLNISIKSNRCYFHKNR